MEQCGGLDHSEGAGIEAKTGYGGPWFRSSLDYSTQKETVQSGDIGTYLTPPSREQHNLPSYNHGVLMVLAQAHRLKEQFNHVNYINNPLTTT